MSATVAEIPRIVTDIQTNHAVFQRPRRITLDSSYPLGGYSPSQPYTVLGATIISKNAEARKYKIEFDQSTGKFVVSEPQPLLIPEEPVTVASHAGQLQKVPAFISTIVATVGGTTGVLRIIPVGETPATGQVAVNFLTGAMVFATADAVTAALVSYIPMGVGPFVEGNRVIDESNTGTNDTTRQTANRVGLLQYFWNDTASTLPTMVPVGEAPSSGEVAFDINDSGNSVFTVNAAQDDASYKITYWKHSALAKYGWTDQADFAATSNAVVLAEVLDLGGIVIPGFGNVLVAEDGTTNKQAIMVGPSGAAATNVAAYDFAKGTLTFDSGDSIDTVEVPYIVLRAEMMDNAFAEVPVGRDLSGVSFDAMLYMRRS